MKEEEKAEDAEEVVVVRGGCSGVTEASARRRGRDGPVLQ